MFSRLAFHALTLATLVLPAAAVNAAPVQYSANLQQLNDSGVSGTANLVLDGTFLTVTISASGLAPNQLHPQHIHGRFEGDSIGGTPRNSVSPPPSADTDGDGFVELAEGVPFYGPVIVSLTSPPGAVPAGFPTADSNGMINFTQTYDLSDPATFPPHEEGMPLLTADDLLPLHLREIVLHGMFVADGIGAGTPGEVDGSNGYLLVLPVATGEIFLVAAPGALPEPASFPLLTTALLGLGIFSRSRKQRAGAAG